MTNRDGISWRAAYLSRGLHTGMRCRGQRGLHGVGDENYAQCQAERHPGSPAIESRSQKQHEGAINRNQE